MMIILFGFYVIVLNGFLYSMDSDQQLKVRSLNCIKEINFVHCLDSTRIIVGHTKGLSIISSKLDQEIKKIIEVDIRTGGAAIITQLSSDQKTIFLGDYDIYNNKEIYKCDIQTASIVKKFPVSSSYNISDYSCHQNIVFLSEYKKVPHKKDCVYSDYILKRYNYDNKTCGNDFFYNDYTVFKVHPKKQILYMFDGDKVFSYDQNNLSIKQQILEVKHNLCPIISVNGSIGLVDQCGKYACIVNPENNQIITLNAKKGEVISKMFFYSEFVAVIISRLSKQSLFDQMSYWDIDTQTSFYSMNLPKVSNVVFFPDGKKCVVVSNKGCDIYKVPVSVRSRSYYVVD